MHRLVLVLGAGFTKAFLPNAPLLTDDYEADGLLQKYHEFPAASKLLSQELSRTGNGTIDLEALMTRLDGGMPYDTDDTSGVLRLLLSDLKQKFIKRLAAARSDQRHMPALAKFAQFCLTNAVTCVTFNYDDVLDQALWDVGKVTDYQASRGWTPEGGYGFFCRPSITCVQDVLPYLDRVSMLLLKLHGSVNWRIRRGAQQPYAVSDLVHHEPWFPPPRSPAATEPYDDELISVHLEPDPFIVPPVLIKSALVAQPVLRMVWSQAYRVLASAEEIIFVGYSLPITDLAARFLFSEAIIKTGDGVPRIRVVNKDDPARTTEEAYRELFRFADVEFDFRGALKWASELSDGWAPGG